MIKSNNTTEEAYLNLNRVLKYMLRKKNMKYYAYMALLLKKKFTDSDTHPVQTAALAAFNTNVEMIFHKDFVYNGVNINTIEQYSGLIVHEINHYSLGHIFQHKIYTDHQIANIAQDIYINSVIERDLGIEYLPGCTDDVEFEKISTKLDQLSKDFQNEVISKEDYKKEFENLPVRPMLAKDFTEKYPEITFDSALSKGTDWLYHTLLKKKEEEQQQQKEGLQEVIKQLQEAIDNNFAHPTDHKWSSIEEMSDGQEVFVKGQQKKLLKDVLENITKEAGDVPGHLSEILKELTGSKKPVTDWKQETRNWISAFGNFTKVTTTKMKPHLIIPNGTRLKFSPDKYILFMIDTSGSMSLKDINEAFEELYNMKKITNFKLDVIEVDAVINDVWEVNDLNDINNKLRKGISGRGGTSLEPGIKFLNENPKYSGAVYITDGYVNKPRKTPKAPVLVITTSNGTNVDWEGYKSIKMQKTNN